MFLLLVSSDLWTYGLYSWTWLLIAVELSLTCFHSADIFSIWFVKNALSTLEYSKGKRSSEAKYQPNFFYVKSTEQLLLIAYGRNFYLFFLFELDLLQNFLLSLQYRFHTRKIHLGNLSFSVDMLIKFIINKIFPEASLVIIQAGINNWSVDIYEFIGDFILIENKASAFPFFFEVVTSNIKLV